MHFSLCFFANDLLLAVYFIFISNYRNDIIQKANSSDFLFEFKMGCKAVETTHNIISAFGLGPANARTVQWRLKTSNQLRIVIEANLLTTTQDVAQETKS